MSEAHDNAVQCMKALLAELPAEFSCTDPETIDRMDHRPEFRVIKRSNVRAVHEALWELQKFLGMIDDD